MLDHTATPVMMAYRRWQTIHAALEAATERKDEARLSTELAELADHILDLPSACAMDVLVKIAAQTIDGECGLDACPRGGEVLAEAVAMAMANACHALR